MAKPARGYAVIGAGWAGCSAALELANVAAGRIDGFFEKGLKVWDIAAGALLVTEAGGIVGEFKSGAAREVIYTWEEWEAMKNGGDGPPAESAA